MADMIKFFKGLEASLPTSGINGALYITTDEGAIYLGTGTGMKRLGDFVQVANVASLPAKAHESCLYYCVAENILAKWNGTEWKQINKQPTAEELKTLLGLGSMAYVSEIGESHLSTTLLEKVNASAEGNHSHSNKGVLDGITAEKVTAWDAAEGNAKTYADGLNTAMNTRVEALEAIDHEHANKALLDTYTQTEADLADAVAKKHAHTFNETELNKIAEGDVAKWNGVVADHLTSEDKTELTNAINAKVAQTDYDAFVEAQGTKDEAQDKALADYKAEMVTALANADTAAQGYASAAETNAKNHADQAIDNLIKTYLDGETDEVINTLEEVAAWINNDTAGVTKIIEDVATNKTNIATISGDLDKVELQLNGIAAGDGTVKAAIDAVDAKFADYTKTADLGDLASKDSLTAGEVGAYTKEEVNSAISTATTDMATNASVDTKLEAYAKTADIEDSLALAESAVQTADLEPYAKTADLGDLASKNESELNLGQYMTTEAHNTFVSTNAALQSGITAEKVGQYDTAYGWGDHSQAGYAANSDLSDLTTRVSDIETGVTELDYAKTAGQADTALKAGEADFASYADEAGQAQRALVADSADTVKEGCIVTESLDEDLNARIGEGETAYGWGNHADKGYAKTADVNTELDKKADKTQVATDIANAIAPLATTEALNGVKATAEAATTVEEVDAQIDAKITALNLGTTYEAIGAEDRAKAYVDQKFTDANLAQYTTEEEVKSIVDGVIASAADSETYNSLTKLVDYIDTHGGEASQMSQAITTIEGKVQTIEGKPAYNITATQISNWDGEVGAKALAETKTTTAEVKAQIEAYGYATEADLTLAEGRIAALEGVKDDYKTADATLKSELQGEIDADVAVVNNALEAYKTSNDAAVALKANSADVYAKSETYTKSEIEALLAWGSF